MVSVTEAKGTNNLGPGNRKFVVLLSLIIAFSLAIWLTVSMSPPARIIKHKITLAVVALIKSPGEERASDWEKMTDAPIPLLESAGAIVDDKIYVFGGIERPSLFSLIGGTAIYVYDPKTDSWTQNADMPTGVTHIKSAVDGQKVWFAG